MIGHLLQAAAIGLAGRGVELLSWEGAQAFGASMGRTIGAVAGKRSRLALDNLRASFPEASEAQLLAWRREAWENLGRVAAEMLWARRRPAAELAAIVEFDNLEILDAALADGGGCLIHLGHFANWELAGLALAAQGRPLGVVARRIRNPYLHEETTKLRERLGTRVLLHKNPFFGCVRALKDGRAVGVLMDQNMPKGELFLPFLGRTASTTPLTALLAHRTGRPIIPVQLRREGSRIRGTFEAPVVLGATPEETTATLNGILERWIRASPGEWFWLHNRWKRQPAPAAPEKAAA
jgi:Kdo2-lipid IVA lauroyltransferase/acyltransferase